MIDSHAHLDFPEFDEDRAEVLCRALNSGVNQFIVPGVSVATWPRARALAQAYDCVSVSYGLHPYFIAQSEDFTEDVLLQWASSFECIAVGECGIDATQPNLPKQMEIFEQHISVANKTQKPLIVHHRKSHHHIMSCFKRVKPEFGGTIHAFSGSLQDAEKYINLGFKLGCGGTISYDRANKTRKVFEQIDLKHIVLETDAPDMPLHGYQGQRNDPSRIANIAAILAELRQLDVEEVVKVTAQNTRDVFAI